MNRILPASGILFTLLIAAIVVSTEGDPPTNEEATAATVRAFYEEHGASARLHTFLLALAGLAVLAFAVHLHAAARERDPGVLPSLGLASGTAFAGIVWLLAFFTSLPGTLPIDQLDDSTVTALYAFSIDGGELLAYIGAPAVAAFVGAFALSARSTAGLPRWVCWLGLVGATLSMLGTPVLLSQFPEAQESVFSAPWFLGFLLVLVWMPAAGTSALLRAGKRTAPAA